MVWEEMDAKKLNIVLICYILIIGTFGMVIIPSDDARAQSAWSLYDAAAQGYVSVYAQGDYEGESAYVNLETGDGIFFGECIEMTVSNELSVALEIEVNLGRQLICQESGIQNMVVTEEYSFTLDADRTISFTVNAMCMNMYEDAPVYGVYYDLGSLASGQVLGAVNQISSSDSQDASGQCALWAVTDSADGDYLRQYGATDNDINKAQALLDAAGIGLNIDQGGAAGGINLGDPLILVIIIIVIVVVILLMIILLKRKTPRAPVQRAQPAKQVQQKQPAAKFCTGCGAPLKSTDKFCTGCGQKR